MNAEHVAKVDLNDFAHLIVDQAARLGAVHALAGQRTGLGQSDTLKQEVARLRALLEEIEQVAVQS